MGTGVPTFHRDMPGVLENVENDLSPRMRRLLTELWEDVRVTQVGLKEVSFEIKVLAAHDGMARWLVTIPGIGELGANALVSTKGFRRGPDLPAETGSVLPPSKR